MEYQIYTFHRIHNGNEVFYPAEYKTDDDAITGAHNNPGTTKVEDAGGKVIWTPKAVN